jgi:hypothetical protein
MGFDFFERHVRITFVEKKNILIFCLDILLEHEKQVKKTKILFFILFLAFHLATPLELPGCIFK